MQHLQKTTYLKSENICKRMENNLDTNNYLQDFSLHWKMLNTIRVLFSLSWVTVMVSAAMLRQSGAGTGSHFPQHAHFWVISEHVQRDSKVSGCSITGTRGILCQIAPGAAPWLPRILALGRRWASPLLSQWPHINSSQFFCPPWPKIPCKKTHSTSHIVVHIYTHFCVMEREEMDVLNHRHRCSCLLLRTQRSVPLSKGVIHNLVHHIKNPIQLEQRSLSALQSLFHSQLSQIPWHWRNYLSHQLSLQLFSALMLKFLSPVDFISP